MLEKLYTRKVVIALMALILAANGLLLYEFRIKPPAQTANTPSSEGSPRIADIPSQQEESEEGDGGEEAEDVGEEEVGEPDGEAAPGGGGDEPESPGTGEPRRDPGGPSSPPGEDAPLQGADSPETPFESQYAPPPTVPGSGFAAVSGDGHSSRIRVALASFYDSEGGGANGPGRGETSILPATSGVVILPAAMFIGAVAVGAVVIAAFRRR